MRESVAARKDPSTPQKNSQNVQAEPPNFSDSPPTKDEDTDNDMESLKSVQAEPAPSQTQTRPEFSAPCELPLPGN